MSDQKISQLTDGSSLQAADLLVVARAGGNYKLSGTELAASFDAAGAAAAAQAASQPLDSDLTAIAALDSSTAGAIASDGAGWVKKTYAQFKTALGLSTADVPDSTDRRYVTDAQRTVIGNTSGTNTGDQTSVSGNAGTATKLATARNIDGQAFDGSANIAVVAPATHAATSKTTPVDADELPLADSAASFGLKKLTWANLKATVKAYTDTLYPSGSGTSTGTNTGDQTISLTGDVTGSGTGSFATTITANAVGNTKFRQGAATSVVGVTGSSTANVADIAGTADQVLRVNHAGSALAFGAIDLSQSAAATGVLQAASHPALTGDVTNSAGSLSTTLGAVVNGTKMAGWTVNAQTGTTYTLVLADAFKIVTLNNASAVTLTIPPNSSVAFPVGTEVICTGIGAGAVTVAAGSGVTINNPTNASLTLAQYMVFRLVKIATDAWEVNKGSRPPDGATLDINASGQIERMALTGDVTASAGSASTTIAASAVTNAKMANMAAKTVKMRHTNSTGAPEDATMANLWADLSTQAGASVDMNAQKLTNLAAGTGNGDSLRYEQLIGLYLLLTGGTMSGAIAMGSNKITGIAAATVSTDAASLANSLDQFATAAANIAMGTHKLTGLAAGTANGDSLRYEQLFGTGAINALYPWIKDLQYFTPTASATWTKPSSGTTAVIIAIGPGGGGGAGAVGSASIYGGAGGGAGGRAVALIPIAALGATVTVQVGAGGAGGTGTSGATGGTGGNGSRNTIFDTTNNIAVGNLGNGGGGGGTSSPSAGTGGTGSAATVISTYMVSSIITNGGTGGTSSITTNGSNGATGSGGGASGVTSGGANSGNGGSGSVSATPSASSITPVGSTASSVRGGSAVDIAIPGNGFSMFGGGGGVSSPTTASSSGGYGTFGGGGGGGGSQKNAGTTPNGGAGGDGAILVIVI